jgi:Holliday junction resolvasome RuvABC endonuclease subunit
MSMYALVLGDGNQTARGHDRLGGEGGRPVNLPRVMGLDLATECSGVALPDGTTTVIRAPKAAGKRRTLADDLARMSHFNDTLKDLLSAHRPDLVVIEDYAAGIRSAAAHRLAEIGGIARCLCHQAGAHLALVNVTHLKMYAAGSSKAEKRDMALAAYKRAGLEFDTDDECDAWWLYTMGRDRSGYQVVDLPKAQREILGRVTWPASLEAVAW